MLPREDEVDAHALRRQGWTISAIARHLGHDRKTIRAYLTGARTAGQRASTAPDPFEPFVVYCRERLAEDPHLWASALFDEVVALGFDRSYPTFTRALRNRRLRPACEPCRPAKDRPVAVIAHPPGEETQWDWVELPDPPPSWGWGPRAYLLVGALSFSGVWRGVLCESMTQPHLIDGLHRVSAALGGLTRSWRFDRMATVVHPESGKVTATFAAVAKHYAVQVAVCPPRHGNRKGVVEKANHTAAQRWWRTLPDEVTVEQAQASLNAWCALRGDARLKVRDGGRAPVIEHAARERLTPLPAPFPAVLSVERAVSAQALVAYRGNFYSVPPELARARVTVTHHLGATTIDITTAALSTAAAASPVVLARHLLAPDGAGVMVRDDVHVTALRAAALAAFDDSAPHRRKQRIPPGPAAQAAAQQLRHGHPATQNPHSSSTHTAAPADATVIDLSAWERAAHGRNTLT